MNVLESAETRKNSCAIGAPQHPANLSNFLDALFGADRPAIRLSYEEDSEQAVTTGELGAFVEAAGGEPIYTFPVVADGGGVAFLYAVAENTVREAWRDLLLPPTAVLWHPDKRTRLDAYALEKPIAETDALDLAHRMGVDLGDAFPTPEGTGWKLVHLDDVRTPVAALVEAYDDAPAVAPEPVQTELEFYGDATVRTPYNEHDPAYAREMVISVGASADSKHWRPEPQPVAKFVANLCRHPVERKKDGPAFVLAEIVGPTRHKKAVKACYGVGLDVDVGTPGELVDTELAKLGKLAIRYTTFSHGKTRTAISKDRLIKAADKAGREVDESFVRDFLRTEEQWDETIVQSAEYTGDEHTREGVMAMIAHVPMPKHRVIIPFSTEFEITKVARTQDEGMRLWTQVPKALARMLGNLPLDKSGVDPSRLWYFPRHAKGKPHETSLFGGSLLDWRELDLEGDAWDAALARVVRGGGKGGGKSTTDAGRELGRWSWDHAEGFQIVDVIRDHAPERIRTNGSVKIDIECPFDEEHSNPGDPDDRACMAVNAGDGPSEIFTIKCQHDSCAERTNLDMLGKMFADGWFPESVLADDAYNALADGAPSTGGDGDDFALPDGFGFDCVWTEFQGRPFFGCRREKTTVPLVAPFAVTGAARYPDRDQLRDVEVTFLNELGAREVVRIAADQIPNRNAVVALLRGRGMVFGNAKDGGDLVHRVLMGTQPPPKLLYDRPGWLPDRSAFVFPTGAVVGADPAHVGLSDLIRINAPATAGTLKAWREGAAVAWKSGSLSLKAALAAGFAGPILSLVGLGTLAVLMTGLTSGGKTWRLMVSVAVSGPPKPGVGQMRSLNSTSNALEAPLERGSGTTTAFDETNLILAELIQWLIFMASGGQGKGRLAQDGGERRKREWSGGVMLLSTEVGLAQLLRQAGERMAGGVTVRAVEVAVDDDGRLSDADFKTANGMLDNYGHALPVFVEHLIGAGYVENPARLIERAERLIERLDGVDTAPGRRAALGVAFLGVAAQLAKDAGLAPRTLAVRKMVRELWEGSRESGVAAVDPVDRAIDQLVETINARRGTEVYDVEAVRDPNREVGCWLDTLDGQPVYLVRESLIGRWSGGAADVRAVVKALRKRGDAIPEKGNKDKATIWSRWRGTVGKTRVLVLRAEAVEG